MSDEAKREVITISYYLDITSDVGVLIAVMIFREHDDQGEVYVREDWQPVLSYDPSADLEYLQSFYGKERLLKMNKTSAIDLCGKENSIRGERLTDSDPQFDLKLSGLIRGL